MLLRRELCVALAALLLLLDPTEIPAQPAPGATTDVDAPAEESDAPDVRLEEIVVRGERRERNLDETAAIQAA